MVVVVDEVEIVVVAEVAVAMSVLALAIGSSSDASDGSSSNSRCSTSNSSSNASLAVKFRNLAGILAHKRETTKDLKNYRPISLFVSVIYKMMMKVITTRISDTLDANQPKRTGRDPQWILSNRPYPHPYPFKEEIEDRKPLCMTFVDYEKTFDTV
ncbi:uncharacterized protein [Penaeus vannamei]|uniref:uncharacterized protein n=1 Tax=Penaeus vannamei TaxID=6689 RepID=UPI00387F7905